MQGMGEIMIILPWPDKKLSPNARTHWASKAKAVKSARNAAGWATRACGVRINGDGAIDLHITFYPPDNRSRDTDNLLASCKGILDGVADGLVVNDSRFILHIARGVVRKGGQVLITLGVVENGLRKDK